MDKIEDGHVTQKTICQVGPDAHEMVVRQVPTIGPLLFDKKAFFSVLDELISTPFPYRMKRLMSLNSGFRAKGPPSR